jgi:DNA repair exonuclease SbcCD ATPase subunit
LTEEQVRELDLPSTPLKETEKRGDRWRAEFGLEQTEIDALATLKPRELRKIIVAAFDCYFDHSLDERAEEIAEAWQAEAQEALDEAIDEDLIAALHAEAKEKLADIREEVDKINEQLRASTEGLGVELPPLPDPPEPELDEEGRLPPLISTSMPWAEQTRALIARKRYGAGGGGS